MKSHQEKKAFEKTCTFHSMFLHFSKQWIVVDKNVAKLIADYTNANVVVALVSFLVSDSHDVANIVVVMTIEETVNLLRSQGRIRCQTEGELAMNLRELSLIPKLDLVNCGLAKSSIELAPSQVLNFNV